MQILKRTSQIDYAVDLFLKFVFVLFTNLKTHSHSDKRMKTEDGYVGL